MGLEITFGNEVGATTVAEMADPAVDAVHVIIPASAVVKALVAMVAKIFLLVLQSVRVVVVDEMVLQPCATRVRLVASGHLAF